MRIAIDERKLVQTARDLLAASVAVETLSLNEEHIMYLTLQSGSPNHERVKLSTLIGTLRHVRIVVFFSKSRKRCAPEETGDSYFSAQAVEGPDQSNGEDRSDHELLNFHCMSCYIVEKVHFRYVSDSIEKIKASIYNPQVFTFTFPDDSNILILACRVQGQRV